jgi:hypothetical protein
MNRAIACRSSVIVVTLEVACHAGGRGFEARRSRKKALQIALSRLLLLMLAQSTAGFFSSRADPARESGPNRRA